jgi:acyl carrier protein
MGLDVVELTMKCEETFHVELEDWRLGQMRTVGDLFELICEQLGLPFGPQEPRPTLPPRIPPVDVTSEGWNRETVWSKVVEICVDQLQVGEEDVVYSANFGDDLKAD